MPAVQCHGQIAGTLAHELGQPGTAINHISAGRRSLESGGGRLDWTRAALNNAAGVLLRTGQVLQRTRDFVADVEPERYFENVRDLTEHALSLALMGVIMCVNCANAAAGICSSRFEPGLLPVLVPHPDKCKLLFSLCRNAIEGSS